MIIEKPGKYRLLKDFSNRGPLSIGTSTCGCVIEIKQVDKRYRKVIGPDLFDWNYWDMPVEIVEVES